MKQVLRRGAMRAMLAVVCLLGAAGLTPAQTDTVSTIQLERALVIEPVGVAQRSAIHTDAIEHLLVTGAWTSPAVGATVPKPDGSPATWKEQAVDASGWMIHRGYVCWTVELPADAIMMLDASGHSLVYVNGELRPGDPYQYGNLALPVALRAGPNELLFYVSRGRLRASLAEPKGEVFFDLRDATLPDLLRGDDRSAVAPLMGGVVVVNASLKEWSGRVAVRFGSESGTLPKVGPIAPLSVRKVNLEFARPGSLEGLDRAEFSVYLSEEEGRTTAFKSEPSLVSLNVRDASDHHIRTFVSDIDGSVQLYSVRPSATPEDGQAMFLSLHGAGVHAPSQSGSYAAKDWGTVVAATNRRQFGFDWEDWGRMDAMEVLREASAVFRPDPSRIYLTGHSMGGHGTWQVGVQYPDRFAAIGPSAGWVSFWSYTGASDFDRSTPVGAIMERATLPSDTLSLSRNLLQYGVYILHGDADDNVPVEQARQMRTHLATYHPDFAYYERPGAGHWWGSACVDWPPMFDFFRHHERPAPEKVHHVEFVTANPSISGRSQWVTIEQQDRSLVASSVDIRLVIGSRQVTGTTSNVRRIAFDVPMLKRALGENETTKELVISLDGNDVTYDLDSSQANQVHLDRIDGQWSLDGGPPKGEKRIGRGGPFKEAFRNRMVFVYGTRGSGEEALWNLSKARGDAEMFYYRGNGSIDVISDVEYNLSGYAGRNVILYGNADTNLAWSKVLHHAPIQVRRGEVNCGGRVLKGDDLACVFAYPNARDDESLVAVVSGTGMPGSRLTERFTYFVSGVHFPDWYIARPDVVMIGADGIVGAGFFDQSWKLSPDDSAWAQ